MPTAEQVVASSVNLVTLPAIFTKVKEVIDDRHSGAMDLARVLSHDPAMTARVLRLINSAFWGVSRQVDSLSRAVSLLGMLQVHDLVLASSVVAAFDKVRPEMMDVKKFWRGSVYRGLAAAALAREAALVDLGRVFTEALMSDLGHMILYTKFPELVAKTLTKPPISPRELALAESGLIGCDFAQVGGALAEAWKLPPCFGASIRHQNNPHDAGAFALEAALIHIAALLAQADGQAVDPAEIVAHIDPFAWHTIGLSPDCLGKIMPDVNADLSSMIALFGV